MTLLITGLLFWSVVHLTPAMAAGIKRTWINRLGENGYAISFAVLIVCSLVLIVSGWRSSAPVPVYVPPVSLKPVTGLLMLLSLMLFVASAHATRVRRMVRHPQMTGVILWSVAHLLQNGDTRSIILFGWLGIWAILEIIFINRRDGKWVKAAPPSLAIEIRYIVISLVAFVIIIFIHSLISGADFAKH